MKTVYVLTGYYSYENEDVLGVYSTRVKAEEAKTFYKRIKSYDGYDIFEKILDE